MKAFIKYVEDGEATGELKEFYERGRNRNGQVPDMLKILSVRPPVAFAKENMRRALIGDASSLGARRADMISVVVSGLNGCRF